MFDREQATYGDLSALDIMRDYAIIKKAIWACSISRDPVTGKEIERGEQDVDCKNLITQCREIITLLDIHGQGLVDASQRLSEKSILRRFSYLNSV